MNDNDLLAAVRDDFAEVRMHTQAQAILANGDSLRRRRRHRAYGAGAAAVAAVAAIGTAVLIPGSAGTGSTGSAHLTAWTVQKQPNGTVDVTIRELQDFAGLQRELNAEGVPAVVYVSEQNPPGCVNAKASADMGAVVDPSSRPGTVFFVIHPAAIPSGSKLLLDVGKFPVAESRPMAGFGAASAPGAAHRFSLFARMDIVYASGNCQ